MIQTVVKRDGRIVGFNEEKIVTAIRKAMLHTDKGEDMQLIRQITDHISFKGEPQMTVEAIQDAVELELMASSRKDVAQKYIAYRNQRSVARKAKTRDMFLEIINIKSNDITRENANMTGGEPVFQDAIQRVLYAGQAFSRIIIFIMNMEVVVRYGFLDLFAQ